MKLQQKDINDVIPFLQLFVDEVEDDRIEMLSLRKRLNIKIGVYVFTLIILFLGFLVVDLILPNSFYEYYTYVGIGGISLLLNQIDTEATIKHKLEKKYKNLFANELYSIITSTLEPTWNYQSNFDFNAKDLVGSDIFSENINVHFINYCIEGDFNFVPLKAYRLHARVNKDAHNSITTNYQGIFIKINLANTINNRAIVAPRISSQNANSNSLHKLNLHQKGYELHNESEVTFNRYFKIYNTQNHELPEILTPTFQRQLAHFVLNHKKEVYLSFQKDKLYISIKTDEASILPSLKGDISPKLAAEHFYNELQILLDLLKRMK